MCHARRGNKFEVSGFVDADVVDTRKSSVDLDRQVAFPESTYLLRGSSEVGI